MTVNCDGRATPPAFAFATFARRATAEGRECFHVGVEFLSLPAALKEQIDVWLEAGDRPGGLTRGTRAGNDSRSA